MQPCSVEIEFYRPDRIFRTGESVQGWVRLTAHRNITCRGLHINGFWKTTGIGNATQKNYSQQTLFQGKWTQGQKYEYPFEFYPPAEPLSYEGKLLNIEHNISARADVTWAQPAQAEETFQWKIGTQVNETTFAQSNPKHRPLPWRMILAIALTFFIYLMAIKYSWWLLILYLLPLYFVSSTLGAFIANRLVHLVDWVVPQSCSPEDVLKTDLHFQTVAAMKPRRVSMELLGLESVATGGEHEQRTYQHLFFRKNEAAIELRCCNDGYHAATSMTLPMTDAYSLSLLDNRISWTLEIQIHFPLGLKRILRREIIVRPKELDSLTKPDDEANPNPAFEIRTFFDLLKVAERLGTDCDQSAKTLLNFDKPYSVVLDVKRIQATSTEWINVEFAGGTTLVGNLPGSMVPVKVLLPDSETQDKGKNKKNKPIEQWTGTAVVAEYCTEQKTLVLLAV